MAQSRRDFLKSVLGAASVVSFTPAVPAILSNAAAAAAESNARESDTVLVVMQLSGGNDGLNTVVPVDDDVYGRARKTLRLTKQQVLPFDQQFGFHPEMQGFKRLFDEGRLMIVQGVGYPKSDRDHETAIRDWHSARPGDRTCQTGWLGRTVDRVDRPLEADVPAALVGSIMKPLAINAESSVIPAVRELRQWTRRDPAGQAVPRPPADPVPADGQTLADLVARGTRAAAEMSERVEKVLADNAAAGSYPNFRLAGELRTVSQLIQADLGIRIFFVELGGDGFGGFDNHANQRDNHAALLRQMSESVAAFVDDLHRQQLLSRVLLMTFSEFGRTVTENGRRGTDHGAAAPLFLVGGRLKGGLCGDHPSLADLDQDAQKPLIDFRRVYATVLGPWLGFDPAVAIEPTFKPLEVLT
ncbi:MAG: DUF1501 domain-containing protein [Planctomycetes bacterium]|nr:DUF1501 domain-containing protein [Planctomycetota bacterium]